MAKQKVELIDPEVRDHLLMVRWRNRTAEWFFDQDPITIKSHLEWWGSVQENLHHHFWMIYSHSFFRNVGTIALVVDPLHSHGEYRSFLIESGLRSRGLGRAGLLELLKFGFGELELHKIFGDILTSNGSAYQVAVSLGFTVEGVFRDHLLRDTGYADVTRLGILKADFQNLVLPIEESDG